MSRILIVEDEQHIADGLRFNLEAEGHDAVVARDGEQALDAAAEGASRVRRRRARRDAAGQGRIYGGRGAARRRPVRADPDADGPRTSRRRAARVRSGRRRLPAEAVRARDPDGAAQRPAAPTALERAGRCDAGAATPRDVYTFAGRTLDFGAMEVRVHGQVVSADADGVRSAAISGARTPGRPMSRGTMLEERLGPARRAPTPAPSTTSSCGCGATSRIGPARRRSC